VTAAGPDHRQVTVCVATHNRSHLLRRLFQALEAQTAPLASFDVVIVDDGSTDDTWGVLEALSSATPLNLTILRHSTAHGPATARNRAWRAATTPTIAFTDDDCVPAPTWLSAGLREVRLGARVVCGRIDPHPDQRYADGPFARKMVVGPAQRRWFATANIFYQIDDLERLDGFDEEFPGAAGEDTELGLRAEQLGIEAVFCSDAYVWHDVRPGRAIDAIRDQRRWSDLPLIFKRHPETRDGLLHRRVFWRASHVELLALLVGAALAPKSRSSLLLTVPWLHGKLCRDAGDEPLAVLVPLLPALLAVDLAELNAMVRGSIRHRALML
jgi:glycosyltransferase involved in cell wall biosynthesis